MANFYDAFYVATSSYATYLAARIINIYAAYM